MGREKAAPLLHLRVLEGVLLLLLLCLPFQALLLLLCRRWRISQWPSTATLQAVELPEAALLGLQSHH